MVYAVRDRWPGMLAMGVLVMIAVLPFLLAGPPPALPVPPPINPGDENWSADFRYPGINGTVSVILAAPNGDIYAGGTFSQADDEEAVGVARWDGARWHTLGGGITGGGHDRRCCFEVTALALGPDGSLYIGGNFTMIGGVTINDIARWDGSQWHAMGGDVSRTDSTDVAVSAIAVDRQGSVYVTGDFMAAGGVAANGIARWDGAAWHALGSGIAGGHGRALAIAPDNSLYVSGKFEQAGGVAANSIARWDGAAWHALGGGPATSTVIDHLAVDQAGRLYAGGWFLNSANSSAQNIARWDGAQWHNLGSGLEYPLTALAVSPDGSVYAGTNIGTIQRWDGSAWAPLPGLLKGEAYDLEIAADGTLYAAADFSSLTGDPLHIARWDGLRWRQLSTLTGQGLGGDVQDMLAAPDGSIYVGGVLPTLGGGTVIRWDGAAWSAVGSNLLGQVQALALGPDGALYAGGHLQLNGGNFAGRVVRWDGAQWQSVGRALHNRLAGSISALAVADDGTLYVGGLLTALGGGNVARWDGADWQLLGAGLGTPGYSSLEDLVIDPGGALYAGGWFNTVNGAHVAASVARWDGADWHAIDVVTDEQFRPSVLALEFHAGSLYAVGTAFTRLNYGPGVARWAGNSWQPIVALEPYGNFKTIQALAFDRAGNLFIGGIFSHIGEQPASNIARWDGTRWHALGAGVNGEVTRLVVDPTGHLFAGGRFTRAGSTGSARIARWTAGDGRCDLTPDVAAIFYPQDQPVAVTLRTPGTLACVSVQRLDASAPQAPPELKTGSSWAIHGTDAQGQPAAGMVFDLSLPLPAGAGGDDQVCGLGIAWHCAADSSSTVAVTRTRLTSFGIWTRAAAPPPGATWELAALAVDTSALTSSAILTYTLDIASAFGGQYTATVDLDPTLTVLAAPGMTLTGHTLSAVGIAAATTVTSFVITVGVDPSFSGTITQTARISGGLRDRTLSAPPVAVEPGVTAPTFRLYLPAIRR